MNTLINNIHILTMDEENREYRSGCIGIDGDTISFVGDVKELPRDFFPCRIIDGRGKLALPGFINTHTHSAMTLFRGYANDMPLWSWLNQKIWPIEDRMLSRDAYWLSLLAVAEMIRGGVTMFADMYMFMDQTAMAVEQAGIRAVLARGLQGPGSKAALRLDEARQLYSDWHGQAGGRIHVMIGPHAVYTCSPDYLKECRDLAAELGVGIHIHLSETRREVEECREHWGVTPVRLLYDLGLLDLHVLAAHCVHLTEEDMDIIKEKGVHVSHCPASNLKLANGFAPVAVLHERGVNVALGTDGPASNNRLSIIREMGLTALVSKGIAEDPTRIPAELALKMATVNGARALGMDGRLGTLKQGYKADIVLIDVEGPYYRPWWDNAAVHLVYGGQAGDVDTVWVDGQMLMENKQLRSIDLERVYYEVNKIRKRIFSL